MIPKATSIFKRIGAIVRNQSIGIPFDRPHARAMGH
jgi:hypothetical protein